MRIGPGGSPERIPEELVLHGHLDAIERGEFVGRAVHHAFRARAIVAADIDDERIVELSEVFHRLDDAAHFIVGVGLVGRIDVRLLDKELLLLQIKRVPSGQLRAAVDVLPVRPRSQLRVLGQDAEFFLIGKNGVAQFLPTVVEEMHRADLVYPLLRRVVRGVDTAGHVIDEEGLVGGEFLELLHVLDGFVGHRRGEVPGGIAHERIDRRRVAEEVRLPLAGVAADESVKILETHAVRPLPERPGLAVRQRTACYGPCRTRMWNTVVLEDGADGALLDRNDRVVAGIPGRDFSDHAEAHRMMVASGDEGGAGRRAERGRVEICVAQTVLPRCGPGPVSGSPRRRCRVIQTRKSSVIISSTFGAFFGGKTRGGHQGVGLGGFLFDDSAEFRIGRRKLFPAEGGGGIG